MKSKKGFSLKEIPALIIVMLVIAITLGIGATILGNLQGTSTMTGTTTLPDSNTVTLINSTAVYFADYDSFGNIATGCSGSSFYNGTNAVNITSDVTIDTSLCTATLTNNAYNNENIQVNYTKSFTTYTYGYNITLEGTQAQDDLSGWQATWVVIVAAAVVLMIIGRYLFFK